MTRSYVRAVSIFKSPGSLSISLSIVVIFVRKAKQSKGSSKRPVCSFHLLSFVIYVEFQLLFKSHATMPTHQEQLTVPAL